MKSRKAITVILSATLICAGGANHAGAAVVTTQQALALDQRQGSMAIVQAALAREEVEQALITLGVDPGQARLRVAALNDQELKELAGHLESLPAGGILELIGAVFVVLLILEVTGVIDIFKKV